MAVLSKAEAEAEMMEIRADQQLPPEPESRNTNELKTPVREMSDREHLEEQTAILRGIQELVGGFFNDMQSGKLNPMQMLMGVMKR